MTGRYFISYSRVDAEGFARRLADALVAGPPSYAVWLDKRSAWPGADWDTQIKDAIQSCQGVLFVMTEDSVQDNSGCKAEWALALKCEKPVIPLRVDASAQLPFRLSSREYIDFSGGFDAGLGQLRTYLSGVGSPEWVLQDLRDQLRKAERELPRADPPQRSRVLQYLHELRQRVADQERLLADPEAARRRTKQQIATELEQERQPERPTDTPPQVKFTNSQPNVSALGQAAQKEDGVSQKNRARTLRLPTEKIEGDLTGVNDTKLYWQGWLPAVPATGVILLCHGAYEHSGRYQNVVDTLAPDGWAVYGLDLRGHGRSGGKRAHVDRFYDWVDDFDRFRREVVSRNQDLPVFVLGHCLGAQIALAHALDHQKALSGLVLSAPFLATTAVPGALVPLKKVVPRLFPRARFKLIAADKISQDPEVTNRYRNDPHVFHGHATLTMALIIEQQFEMLIKRSRHLSIPVLIQHGAKDAIADQKEAGGWRGQSVRPTGGSSCTKGLGTRSTTSLGDNLRLTTCASGLPVIDHRPARRRSEFRRIRLPRSRCTDVLVAN